VRANVDLAAADGTALKGTYFAAAKTGACGFYCCTMRRARKLWDVLAERMVASGVSVYSGLPRSEKAAARRSQVTGPGTRQVFNDLWPGDIELAYSYLLAQPEVPAR